MIIPEDTPESPSKLRQEQPLGSSYGLQANPPAYTGHSFPNPGPQYLSQPYPNLGVFPTPTSPLNGDHTARVSRHNPKTRFFLAFWLAIAVYVLIGVLLRGAMLLANKSKHKYDTLMGYPRASDGQIDFCVHSRGDYRIPTSESQHLTFELPLDADVLYLFSRGSGVSGTITLLPNDFAVGPDKMQVDIAATYESIEAFKRTTICSLQRKPGEHGVGIFTPFRYWASDTTHFNIIVKLPPFQFPPFFIQALEVNLPLFRIIVPESSIVLRFGSLSLRTTNQEISIGHINAHDAYIETSNSPIAGTFKTTSTLTLRSSNAPISVNVEMEHDVLSTNRTVLDIETSNGVLTSVVSLSATNHSPTHSPRYIIVAKTSNAPLNVHFPQQHSSSHLDLAATTSNGAASVRLNPAYEGSFELSTLNHVADVVYDQQITDPAMAGRTRKLEKTHIKGGKIVGWVEWEDGVVPQGSVVVRTSSAPNALILQ